MLRARRASESLIKETWHHNILNLIHEGCFIEQRLYMEYSVRRHLYMRNSGQSIAPSISLILKKIADEKTLTLFNTIAVADGDKYIPLKEMNLTTKQYYSRISGLVDAGLIKRLKGRYSVTALGKVVYQSQMIITKTLSYYWKLRAIESVESEASTNSSSFSNEEMKQMIDAFIEDNQVKDHLMNSVSSSSYPSSSISSIE